MKHQFHIHVNLLFISVYVLTPAASLRAEEPHASMTPKWEAGLEFFYEGKVHEENYFRSTTSRRQSYRLQMRMLIIDAKAGRADAAFLTIFDRLDRAEKGAPLPQTTSSARLETSNVDNLGIISSSGTGSHWFDVTGPSTWEAGFISPLAHKALSNATWAVTEPNRPPLHYRIHNYETIAGVPCIKLRAEQHSQDWRTPRADSTAWRRIETVWISPRTGVTHRVERRLERRDPAHRQPTYRLTTTYDLVSRLVHKGTFLEDRIRDIQQAGYFHSSIESLLPNAAHHRKDFEAILARIDSHMEKYPETPYRAALQAVRRLAIRGQKNDVPIRQTSYVSNPGISIGKSAPSFAVKHLSGGATWSLRQARGRPVLLVFYRSDSSLLPRILGFIADLQELDGVDRFSVALLCMSSQNGRHAAPSALEKLNLTAARLNGRSLRTSYNVESTPKFVVLDGKGVVRATYTGWGPEAAGEIPGLLRGQP